MTIYNHITENYIDLTALASDWYAEGISQRDVENLLIAYAWHSQLNVSIPELERASEQGCP